jgi:DNA mismatch repair protein MutS
MAEEKKITPFMAQYLGAKEQHPDKLLLFRMGDFNEDAKTASAILGITLTSRDAKSANPTPMAGIPHHSLGDYLPKLIKAGIKVAICDQVEDPALAKGIVKREVVRVVTRGTLTEDSLLNPVRNNYLMALCEQGETILLAYLDYSTGEIFVRQTDVRHALDTINVVGPEEIIVPRSFDKRELCRELRRTSDSSIVLLDEWNFGQKNGQEKIAQVYGLHSSEGIGLASDSPLIRPLGALLDYLATTQMTTQLHLRRVQTVQEENYMILDRQTCRNLEIFQNQQDGSSKGSLFECLNETATPMGARRLATWLSQPLLRKADLQKRFEAVQAFCEDLDGEAFRKLLSSVRDLERPLGRLRAGRFSPRDLKSLGHSLQMIPELNLLLKTSERLKSEQQVELNELAERIDQTLLDELPALLGAGDMIRPGNHGELDSWKNIRDGGKSYLDLKNSFNFLV